MDRKKLFAERQKQHKQCTKSIKDFLNTFIDSQSFVENNEFFANDDGGNSVIWGRASIDGRPVFLVAQNSEVMQGGMSAKQADKFVFACKEAGKTHLPVVFVLDSCGGKIEEGVSLVDSYAKILSCVQGDFSPYQTRICVVKGNALGNMAVFASMCDFVYMTDESVLSLNSPSAVCAGQNISGAANELFGKKLHSEKTGVCTFYTDKDKLGGHLAKMLGIMSPSCDELSEKELNKALPKIEQTKDIRERIAQLADADGFVEFRPDYAQEIITGIAKIGGYPVGIIANNPGVNGKLTYGGVNKATQFANFLLFKNMTLLTLVDCGGVDDAYEQEQSALSYQLAEFLSNIKFLKKLSLITGKAIGLGFTALAAKSMGYNHIVAWESAVVAPVCKTVGGPVIYSDEIASADDPVAAREQAIEKYETVDSDPYYAAEAGLIDNVIDAKQSRVYLIAKLQSLACEDKII